MTYLDLTNEKLLQMLEERDNEILGLKKKIEDISIIDEVTSTYNKGYMYKTLDYEMKRAQRNQSYLNVLMLGINNFQSIREKYGEDISNMILLQIARLIKSSLRSIDIVGKYSYGDFIIILPDMNPNKGSIVVDRIQKLMDKETFPIESRITISYGLKHYEGETINRLLDVAEANLNTNRKDFIR